MTTCRDTITQALRLTKVIASGDAASADEADDGMVALQSFYDQLVTGGMFGTLRDFYKTDEYEAKEGERITAPAGVTITFPETLSDNDNGGDRVPRDLACIETIIDGARTVKIWDRTGWVDLLGLDLNDTAPLAERNAFGLAAALAVSGGFAAMFGSVADIGPDVRVLAAQFNGNISRKATTRDRIPAGYY